MSSSGALFVPGRAAEAGMGSCGLGTVCVMILLSGEPCQAVGYAVSRADCKELARSFS